LKARPTPEGQSPTRKKTRTPLEPKARTGDATKTKTKTKTKKKTRFFFSSRWSSWRPSRRSLRSRFFFRRRVFARGCRRDDLFLARANASDDAAFALENGDEVRLVARRRADAGAGGA
jgi:hypothetical protein